MAQPLPFANAAIQTLMSDIQRRRSLDDLIQNFVNFQFPENEIQRRIALINQALASQQRGTLRQVQEALAARTGGRLSPVRPIQNIGGQFALAQSQAIGQLLNQLMEQRLRMKLAGLQAYIQKYGIDENVRLALKKLKSEEKQALFSGLGNLFGGVISVLPFI